MVGPDPRSCPCHAPPAPLAPCSRNPTRRSPTRAVGHAARLCWCWWCCRAPQVGPHRAKGVHERGPCWWCSALPLSAGSHFEARINRPWPLPPSMLQMYVSSVSNIIRGMLQVFHMNVAKVDRDVAYFASVSKVCCKRLFKIFHLFQTYVASAF
jgi:hypothetical protein